LLSRQPLAEKNRLSHRFCRRLTRTYPWPQWGSWGGGSQPPHRQLGGSRSAV